MDCVSYINHCHCSALAEELLASGISALGQPGVAASTLPLLLGTYLKLVIVLDYS